MSNTLKDAIPVEQAAAGQTEAVQTEANTRKVYTTLADLGPLKDEAADDNVLFSGNWLGRGGGLLITASSGVGKSSLIVQSLLSWSLGKEFLARPNNWKRLKCALVQSEDSQRDLQEIRDGMIRGFTSNGWTDEEVNDAVGSMHIWNCVGKVGKDFCEWLRAQQHDDPVDIIAINPIQGFFGGDISKQEDVSRFLREGLDPILKGEYGTKPCAAVLVQHTPKITATKDGNDAEVGNYGEYLGAGSHEWTDWTRANLVFLKHKGSSDFFDLQAAKRGKRLGWICPDGHPTIRKLLAHSTGYIYWRIVTDPQELEAAGATAKPKEEKPKSKLQEKHDRDLGLEKNCDTLAEHVMSVILDERKINNGELRKWAEEQWVKETARKVVTRFESSLSNYSLGKDKDGYYMMLEKTDCQNDESAKEQP